MTNQLLQIWSIMVSGFSLCNVVQSHAYTKAPANVAQADPKNPEK